MVRLGYLWFKFQTIILSVESVCIRVQLRSEKSNINHLLKVSEFLQLTGNIPFIVAIHVGKPLGQRLVRNPNSGIRLNNHLDRLASIHDQLKSGGDIFQGKLVGNHII